MTATVGNTNDVSSNLAWASAMGRPGFDVRASGLCPCMAKRMWIWNPYGIRVESILNLSSRMVVDEMENRQWICVYSGKISYNMENLVCNIWKFGKVRKKERLADKS